MNLALTPVAMACFAHVQISMRLDGGAAAMRLLRKLQVLREWTPVATPPPDGAKVRTASFWSDDNILFGDYGITYRAGQYWHGTRLLDTPSFWRHA